MDRISPDSLKFVLTLAASTPQTFRYYERQTIEFEVVNTSGDTLFIEAAHLKFQPDTGAIPNYVECCPSLRLVSTGKGFIRVDVCPLPLYMEYTNQFDVLLKYRLEVGGRLGKLFTEPYEGFYTIINTAPPSLGDVFISFKQPEDQRLANILARYARRGGFSPNIFVHSPSLGAHQWKSIEKLIAKSHSIFVVWGRRTEWGIGVRKEIRLCRRHHLREILLVEDGIALPDLYQGTKWTYKRYDPIDPARALCDAVSSLRDQAIHSGDKN